MYLFSSCSAWEWWRSEWHSSLYKTVSPYFVFSSFQQHFLFSVSICAFQWASTEKFIFQNRVLNVLHWGQFILKCMNVVCIMFILTCLTNHQFFILLKESRGSEVFSFLLVLCVWDWTVSLSLIIWWATWEKKGTQKNSLKITKIAQQLIMLKIQNTCQHSINILMRGK